MTLILFQEIKLTSLKTQKCPGFISIPLCHSYALILLACRTNLFSWEIYHTDNCNDDEYALTVIN
jgi:hypothetical protein